MIPKLNGCYAIRLMVYICNINTFKTISYAYFYSIVKYGVIFWGNTSNSSKIFSIQKQVVRIMASVQCRTSCTSLFKDFTCSRPKLSLMNCIINNQENFHTDSSITMLIQGISTILIDQMPTHLDFRKVHFLLASKFLTVYHLVRKYSRMTRQNSKKPKEST